MSTNIRFSIAKVRKVKITKRQAEREALRESLSIAFPEADCLSDESLDRILQQRQKQAAEHQ